MTRGHQASILACAGAHRGRGRLGEEGALSIFSLHSGKSRGSALQEADFQPSMGRFNIPQLGTLYVGLCFERVFLKNR